MSTIFDAEGSLVGTGLAAGGVLMFCAQVCAGIMADNGRSRALGFALGLSLGPIGITVAAALMDD